MGIWLLWQMGAASSERDEATSPRMATTPSSEISLRASVEGWPAWDWSSSVMSWTCLPRTPPAALRSSTARAVPAWDDCPNEASLPVSEAYSPTLMTSLALLALLLAPVPCAGGEDLLQPTRRIETA